MKIIIIFKKIGIFQKLFCDKPFFKLSCHNEKYFPVKITGKKYMLFGTNWNIPQPVWAAAFGLAQTPCDAGLAVSRFRNFQPA